MIRSESPTPSGGEAAGAAKFGSIGGAGSAGGKVYMGSTLTEGTGPGGVPGKVMQANLVPKQEAYGVIDNFSGKQLRDFVATGQAAGLLEDGAGYMEAQTLWKKLVDASARLTAAGRKIAPTDVLAGYLGKGPLAGKVGASGAALWQEQWRSGRKFLVNTQTGEVKYQGPRFETTYQQNIDLTDPATAKALATSVFQQLLHRDPGKGELDGWASALRTAEQQSPSVTQTTTEYDPTTGEPVGTSSTSAGGMTADAKAYMAQQRIKKTKEYGAVQAATTYANALENAVFNNPFGSL